MPRQSDDQLNPATPSAKTPDGSMSGWRSSPAPSETTDLILRGAGEEQKLFSVAVTGGRLVQMAIRLAGPRIEPPGVADRLAPVGVDTVSRVEASGPFGERSQLLPSRAERLDVAVEGRHVPFQKVDDVVAGGLSLAAEIEDGGDLGEGQTGGLGVPDELEAIDSILCVVPVVVQVTGGFGNEPDLFVVADGLGSCPGSPG